MKINRREFIQASAMTFVGAGLLKAQKAKLHVLLSRMTLEEKIGQMIQANSASLKIRATLKTFSSVPC